MNKDDILSACDSGPEQRTAINLDELQGWLLQRHEQMQDAVNDCRRGIYLKGLMATDFYYKKSKEVAFTTDETKILPRVRWDPRTASPIFHWNRLIRKVFPLNPTDPKPAKGSGCYIGNVRLKGRKAPQRMKVVLSGKHIGIQKATDGIAASTFSQEPLWAQIAGEAAEQKLRSLRKQAKLLSEISRRLAVLKRMMEAC